MKRIALAVLAVGIIATVAYAAPDVEPWRSIYEQRQHKVPQKFEKEVQFAFIDAGTGSRVAGKNIAAAQPVDGGLGTSLCQFGNVALTSGDAGVVFRSTFTALPSCACSHVATTNANACVISTAATTTAVGLSALNAGTDVVNFVCCGDL